MSDWKFTDVNATKPCSCGGTMVVKRDFSLPQMDSYPPIWSFNWFCPQCKNIEEGGSCSPNLPGPVIPGPVIGMLLTDHADPTGVEDSTEAIQEAIRKLEEVNSRKTWGVVS